MNIGHLPSGTRGFDANSRITPAQASDAFRKRYRFAVRYVRRAPVNSFDITAGEMATILDAGLGLMLVQHVAQPGWHPSLDLGRTYGDTAAQEATRAGYPKSGHLWCDLEEVASGTPAQVVIDYCNAWHRSVEAMGFLPGLYVGYGTRLTGEQLYRKLRFSSYWAAYNLNRDQAPTVRGVCMRQHAASMEDLIVGLTNDTMDVDVIQADAMGDTPTLLLP